MEIAQTDLSSALFPRASTLRKAALVVSSVWMRSARTGKLINNEHDASLQAALRIQIETQAITTLLATRDGNWPEEFLKDNPDCGIKPLTVHADYTHVGVWPDLGQLILLLAEKIYLSSNLSTLHAGGKTRVHVVGDPLTIDRVLSQEARTFLHSHGIAKALEDAELCRARSYDLRFMNLVMIGFSCVKDGEVKPFGQSLVEAKLQKGFLDYGHEIHTPVVGWIKLKH